MKITLNIDDDRLASVMKATGATTKTEAIHLALSEIHKRRKLVEALRQGSGVPKEELHTVIDPNYDLIGSRIAESAALYGKTGPSR